MSRRRSLLWAARVLLPALAAGVGMALSLPPFGWWVLAPLAAAVLWWRLGGLGAGQRLMAGWAFGIGCYAIGLWWVHAFNVYGAVVLVVVEALSTGVASALAPAGRGRTVGLAGAMVVLEWVRSSWPLGGLPLGGMALGQAGGPLANATRLGGPLLLVGLVWLAGAGVGSAVVPPLRRWHRRRVLRREPAGWRQLTGQTPPAVRHVDGVAVLAPVAAGLTALAVVVGLAAAGNVAGDGGPPYAQLRVAAVQGGGIRGFSKEEVDPASVFDAQVAATRQLVGIADPPELVLWPEDVVALDRPLAGSADEQTVASLAVATHSSLLAGVTEPVGNSEFRNEIVAFGPDGRIVDTFEKVHRVPFGEYIPWRGFFGHLADLSAVPQDAVPGHGDGVLHTPAAKVGTMVSYEVFFADRARVATRAGATLLAVPTNTSSYSTSQVPTQEIAAARLQALSEGRDLVQAAPTGFSAFIDHDGRVMKRSDLGSRAVLVATLGLRHGRTIYERLGDLAPLLAAALGVLAAWGMALTGASGPRGESVPDRQS